MRFAALLAPLACSGALLAQNWYIPDPSPSTGTCNVIPFGNTTTASFGQAKYQQRCTAAELGNVAGLITGLGFAACNTGRAHYDSLEIILDHIPAAQPLSTTFANNLTAAAVTVLQATNYTWNTTANTWNEVGLQNFFVYNGTDDLVVQVTTVNGTAPGGMHRGTRERIYWVASTGTPPATGTSGAAASKIEVSMLTAHMSSHGDGCLGSNGTPLMTLGGSAVLGSAATFALANGVANGFAFFATGFGNGAPYPLDLGIIGASGCYQYFSVGGAVLVGLDGAGGATTTLGVPLNPAFAGILFYSQYACLDTAANSLGLTTSNYGRVLVGN
jgi:hypothetical protein